MKKIFYYLFVFCCLSSCTPDQSGLLVLDNSIELKAIEYDNEIIMVNPLGMELINNRLYLFQPEGDEAALIVDPETGVVTGTWGRRGNGPGEFYYPLPWGINRSNHTMQLYDLNRFRIRKYNYDKDGLHLTQELPYRDKEASVRQATTLENGNIVASVIFGNDKPLLLLSSQLDSLYNWGDVPDESHRSTDLRDYSGYLDSYRNTFVFAMSELGYIVCYEQNGKETPVKKWEHFLQYPIYKGNRLDWKLQKQGFGDIQMTPHYVFCVYSGKRWNPNEGGNNGTDNILVFNHKGKLLNYFHLDNVIGNIAVSEDEKMIYAISYEPEYRVVRYKIGDYL